MSKVEKKSVFLHEKGHLISRDNYKIIFTKAGLALFPNFIRENLLKRYILFLETKADKYASRYINKTDLAKTILHLKSAESYHPMINNFTEERLKVLLQEKNVTIPLTVYMVITFLLSFFLFISIYKTCFCGAM